MLARDLGMTVRQLHQNTDSRELSEWLAFYKVEAREKEEFRRKAETEDAARQGVEKVKQQLKAR